MPSVVDQANAQLRKMAEEVKELRQLNKQLNQSNLTLQKQLGNACELLEYEADMECTCDDCIMERLHQHR